MLPPECFQSQALATQGLGTPWTHSHAAALTQELNTLSITTKNRFLYSDCTMLHWCQSKSH